MDLIALAVPFFLLAIVVEWLYDRRRGAGFVQFEDALGSLGAGALSTTTEIFSKLAVIAIYAFALEHFAVWRMPESWFDLSPRGIACWLGVLLLWDFAYYWKHRLGHEWSLFWAAHSVHHQSEEYNLTTALRQTSTDFLIGWTVYLPLFLLGVPLHVFITVGAIDLIYQFWVHTRHIDKLGWADRVFVTPSNHRVHHAQNGPYIDKNYGGILILWDRLFGTFAEEDPAEPVIFGVRKPLASYNPFTANLQVYRYLWFDARRTRRWRDKLGIWFRRTGWRPADVAAAFPKRTWDASQFAPYRVAHTPATRAYLGFQFAVTLVLTLVIGVLATQQSLVVVLIVCTQLWLLLAGIGLINDASTLAIPFEIGRLLAVVPLTILLAQRAGLGAAVVIAAVVYATISAAALLVLRSNGLVPTPATAEKS